MRFHFANPGFLWLCLAVPPLLWWWLRQRRRALRHPAVGFLSGLPSGRARIARWGGALLRALALLLVAVALAGPRWPDQRTRIETEGVAIMMVLDVSGTVDQADFKWNGQDIKRFEASKRAFMLFVKGGTGDDGATFNGRPTDLIGLVAFADRPDAVCPPTLSHSAVLKLLEQQDPQKNIKKGEARTNISDALVVALVRLKNTPARRKCIVMFSDGEDWPGITQAGWTPAKVAGIAAEMNVPIYCIDADSRPEMESTNRREGVALQRELTERTGGKYFPSSDTHGMLDAYQSIDRLEKSDITSYRYRRYHEAYPWLGAAAFMLLVLTMVLEMTVWRKLP